MGMSPGQVDRIVFGGTFIARESGDYVVFAWSSVYARDDRLHGVVTKGQFATPVRLRVGRATMAHQRVARLAAGSVRPYRFGWWY
jgi:hypothetical protein